MRTFGKRLTTLRNYLVVGVSAFAVEYISFAFLFSMIGVAPVFAQPTSFLVGLCISFIGNRYLTFKPDAAETHSNKTRTQVLLFLGLGIFNLITSTLLLLVLIDGLKLYPLVAKLIIMCAIVTWNYVLLGRLIFRTNKAD